LSAQQTLFSCQFGARQVSFCHGAGGVVARHADQGEPVRVSADIAGAKRVFSGGGETQVSFINAGRRYIVYDRTERTALGRDGRHDARSSTGLLVMKGGQRLAEVECRSATRYGDPAVAAERLPTVDFVDH
jgi:hypothetical protein